MIPQMEPWFDEQEQQAVLAYMASGGFLTEFRVTREFEEQIAAYVGVNHAVMMNSGASALVVAMMAHGIGPGDEVIVPNFTMIATANAVVAVGATPVFVDVEASTLCLDFEFMAQAVGPKTRAVMLVAINGRTPSRGIHAYADFCQERGLILIEDSAQALGSHYPSGGHVGTTGSASILSFSVPKIITTGQGGCLLTNSAEISDAARKIKDFGRVRPGQDVHERIGYNFKFTDVQAAIGLVQLSKLEERIERKRAIFRRYTENLTGCVSVRLIDNDLSSVTPWFIECLVDDREEVQRRLADLGVGSRPMYPPINEQVVYSVPGVHAVSRHIGEHGLWLPSASQLTEEQVDQVCESLVSATT